MRSVYLDASALVKWTVVEEGSEALRKVVVRAERWLTSVLSEVEVRRTFIRRGLTPYQVFADELFSKVHVIEPDRIIRDLAVDLAPRSLASMDAIHVATALTFPSQVDAFITYDRRQADAAARHGLNVLSPE